MPGMFAFCNHLGHERNQITKMKQFRCQRRKTLFSLLLSNDAEAGMQAVSVKRATKEGGGTESRPMLLLLLLFVSVQLLQFRVNAISSLLSPSFFSPFVSDIGVERIFPFDTKLAAN